MANYSDSRREVIERDRVCFLHMQEFNEMRQIEEVHHVVPRSLWGWHVGDKHDPKNLIGVCRYCHAQHKPFIQAPEMIRYILGKLHDLYGYDYPEPRYRPYVVEMYEERGEDYEGICQSYRVHMEPDGVG